MKLKVNENLTSIISYINEQPHIVTWFELVQYCIDYRMYEDLYMSQTILNRLVCEHNESILKDTWKKPN